MLCKLLKDKRIETIREEKTKSDKDLKMRTKKKENENGNKNETTSIKLIYITKHSSFFAFCVIIPYSSENRRRLVEANELKEVELDLTISAKVSGFLLLVTISCCWGGLLDLPLGVSESW